MASTAAGEPRPNRRLAVVLAADAVSFTTKMERDASGTVTAVVACRRIMEAVVRERGGRVVSAPGDFILVSFDSASDAVDAALAFVDAIAAHNAGEGQPVVLQYRVGLGLGEVFETGGDLLGPAVNMAARLQQVARPEQVLVPADLHQAIRDRHDITFVDLGDLQLRSIGTPIRVYEVRGARFGLATPATAPPAEPPAASSLRRAPNVIVRSFRPVSGNAGAAHIGESLTQQLVACIAGLSPRINVFEDEPARVDGEVFVLAGTIELDRQLVVTARLSARRSGQLVWAGRFAIDIERRLDLQSDIVRHVVESLQVTLSEGEQARFWHQSTRSFAAWEAFQQGKDFERQFRRESHRRAREAYGTALLEDPGFVSALAALAFCHLDEARLGWSDDPQRSIAAAEALAARAGGHGVESADLHVLDGFIALMRGRNDDAVTAARRAAGIAPRSTEIAAYVGAIYRNVGAFDRAIDWYQRAQSLSPVRETWIDCNIANVRLLQRRARDAVEGYRAVLERDPGYLNAHVGAAAASAQLGDAAAAASHAREVRLIDPLFVIDRWAGRFAGSDPDVLAELKSALKAAGLG